LNPPAVANQRLVLIGSVTPSLLKTPENPAGTPIEVFDGFRQAVITNRAQALLNSCWNQDMIRRVLCHQGVLRDRYEQDLKTIDVPTLILHGDVDQIVPIGNAYRSSKLIPNATLKMYPGAPHAMISITPDNSLTKRLSLCESFCIEVCSIFDVGA
jgi:non-heme chloroperoxidase